VKAQGTKLTVEWVDKAGLPVIFSMMGPPGKNLKYYRVYCRWSVKKCRKEETRICFIFSVADRRPIQPEPGVRGGLHFTKG
jgi:hypothetical protein